MSDTGNMNPDAVTHPSTLTNKTSAEFITFRYFIFYINLANYKSFGYPAGPISNIDFLLCNHAIKERENYPTSGCPSLSDRHHSVIK